uniref:Putative secreted protein n=1 Tax=Ixodes ricinus TaxID=34613 RepID=A0A6B0UM12_IXORI
MHPETHPIINRDALFFFFLLHTQKLVALQVRLWLARDSTSQQGQLWCLLCLRYHIPYICPPARSMMEVAKGGCLHQRVFVPSGRLKSGYNFCSYKRSLGLRRAVVLRMTLGGLSMVLT